MPHSHVHPPSFLMKNPLIKKKAFEGKDIGLCYAYTGWILAFLYLEEVIVYSHREYKMCRRALSARSSQ